MKKTMDEILYIFHLEDKYTEMEKKLRDLKVNKKIYISLISGLLLFLIAYYSFNLYQNRVIDLEIHFIDVGQGDAILVRTKDGKNILVDSGPNSSEDIVRRYLKIRGIKKIDYLLASHYDEDHIGNHDYIIKNIKTSVLLVPKHKGKEIDFHNMINACKNRKAKIKGLMAGDHFKIGKDLKIKVLSPSRQFEDENENSLVLHISYGSASFLLTGDATKANELDIINNYKLNKLSVLKAGHHGSKTSSCEEFISQIKPQLVVISCGYKNKFGHPHEEVLNTFKKYQIPILRTDEDSTIELHTDGKKIYRKNRLFS